MEREGKSPIIPQTATTAAAAESTSTSAVHTTHIPIRTFLVLDRHSCQMAKFGPFLGLRRVGGHGGAIRGKEGIEFCSVG